MFHNLHIKYLGHLTISTVRAIRQLGVGSQRTERSMTVFQSFIESAL